jgi:hypothetical protein
MQLIQNQQETLHLNYNQVLYLQDYLSNTAADGGTGIISGTATQLSANTTYNFVH